MGGAGAAARYDECASVPVPAALAPAETRPGPRAPPAAEDGRWEQRWEQSRLLSEATRPGRDVQARGPRPSSASRLGQLPGSLPHGALSPEAGAGCPSPLLLLTDSPHCFRGDSVAWCYRGGSGVKVSPDPAQQAVMLGTDFASWGPRVLGISTVKTNVSA